MHRKEAARQAASSLWGIRAHTDLGNAASQKVLLACGLKRVGEIELLQRTHSGERHAPLFRILRPKVITG
ncbi:MAG: hypothetical protein JOZ36_09445 [Acidobacteria bacterium]|nr:hypothetical protein [Acidobacteriota bacterium]